MSVVASDGEHLPCEAILERVAAREGVDPLDLDEPLYGSVDPDALESLLASGSGVTVRFTYAGYDVTVSGDGRIEVR